MWLTGTDCLGSITSISSDGSAYSTSSTSVCSSPAIPAPKHYSPKNISSGARAGRIAVTCGDKSCCGYISRSPDRDGVYYVTQNASEALHVQVEPAKDNQLMEIRLMVGNTPLLSGTSLLIDCHRTRQLLKSISALPGTTLATRICGTGHLGMYSPTCQSQHQQT